MWSVLNPIHFINDEKQKNNQAFNYFLFKIERNNKPRDNRMDSLRLDILSRHYSINDNDRLKLKERRLDQIYNKSNNSNIGPKQDFIAKYNEIFNLATNSTNSTKNPSSKFDEVFSKLETYNKYYIKSTSKTSSTKKLITTKNIFDEIKDESNSFIPMNFTDYYMNTIHSVNKSNLSPINTNSKYISSNLTREKSFSKYNKYNEGGGIGQIRRDENSFKFEFEKLNNKDYYKIRPSSSKIRYKKNNIFEKEKDKFKNTPSKYNNEMERFRWTNHSRRFGDFSYNKIRNNSMNYKFNTLKAKLDLLLVK